MAAIKSHQVSGFLKTLDERHSAVLFYGADSGLVSERAQLAVERFAARIKPSAEIIRLDDSDLEATPDRLAIELQIAPMFGGGKVVRAIAGRRLNAALLKPILEAGALAAALVVEAGPLKGGDTLRALFERTAGAAAVPCYSDAPQDLTAIVREELAASGQDIAGDAMQVLVSRLGADRALSRSEIEKLKLYAAGKKTIELDDVEAVIGDAAEQTIDRVISAAASGRAGQALRECDRAVASGEDPQAVVAALQRYFHRLHRLRAQADAGVRLEDAMRQLRPEPHFRHKAALEEQVRLWSMDQMALAIAAMAETAVAARLSSDLEQPLAERLLMRIAGLARQSESQPR